MKTHTKNQAHVTEILKFRKGSLGGLAHQVVQFKAPEKSNSGSPYVKVDCWDGNAVKSVARLIAAAPYLLAALKEAQNQLSTFLFEASRYGLSNEQINQMSAATLIADRAIAKAEGGK
jgi:hypothetical protein